MEEETGSGKDVQRWGRGKEREQSGGHNEYMLRGKTALYKVE